MPELSREAMRAAMLELIERFDQTFVGESGDLVRGTLIYLVLRDLLLSSVALRVATDEEIVEALTELLRAGLIIARQELDVPHPRPH
jgi:hypothetical protein